MKRPANENPKLKGSPFYDTLYRDIGIPFPTTPAPIRIASFRVHPGPGPRPAQPDLRPYNYDRDTCLEHHIRYYQTITGLDHVIGGLLETLSVAASPRTPSSSSAATTDC
jgi:hypothetical protein